MQKIPVIIMAKAPLPGFVKTRLQDRLSPEQCVELYQGFLLDIVDCIRGAGFPVYVAFTPGDKGDLLAALLPEECLLFPQQGIDLGERMEQALSRVMSITGKAAIIIGSDIPSLKKEQLLAAEKVLQNNDVCLGPSQDGGYYLLGMAEPNPAIFAGINWGTETVFAETVANILTLNLTYQITEILSDIDHFQDLVVLQEQLQARSESEIDFPKRTWELLNQTLADPIPS